MKKWILLIVGSLLSLVGLVQCGKLLAYIDELTEMGTGYMIGSLLLLIIGIILIIIGMKANRN